MKADTVYVRPEGQAHWAARASLPLLPILHRIPSVESNPKGGVTWHESDHAECLAALSKAGLAVTIDAPGFTSQPPRRRDFHYHPPGEELTCPKCTPGYQRPPEILALIEQVKRDLAERARRHAD